MGLLNFIGFINYEMVDTDDLDAPLEFMKVSYTYYRGLGYYRNEFHRDIENGVVIGITSRRISEDKFFRAMQVHVVRHSSPIEFK